MPDPTSWARVLPGGLKPMRRGAWYPVVEEDETIVTAMVRNSPLMVNREFVTIRRSRPTHWSVVEQTADAPPPVDASDELGLLYVVCPACRTRAPITRDVTSLDCQMCGAGADVDWSETC